MTKQEAGLEMFGPLRNYGRYQPMGLPPMIIQGPPYSSSPTDILLAQSFR